VGRRVGGRGAGRNLPAGAYPSDGRHRACRRCAWRGNGICYLVDCRPDRPEFESRTWPCSGAAGRGGVRALLVESADAGRGERMMRRVVVLLAALACLVLGAATPAQAYAPVTVVHQEQVQAGPYHLVVGFSDWPLRAS